MNASTVVTYIIIAALIVFGIYRKNRIIEDNFESSSVSPYVLSGPTLSETTEPMKESSYVTSKHHVAVIAYKLEQQLEPSESIIQVHDYTNEPVTNGHKHTFDVTLYNSSNTQALTKRIECLEKGDTVEILSTQIMSPITGSLMTKQDLVDDVSDLLLDDVDSDGDVKFVRDKYTFVKKDILPPEPSPLSKECTRQLNEGQVTNRCQTQLNIYTRSMAEYRKQVQEAREKGTFTRRRLGFAPMNETIADDQKYPFSQPQTFGYAAHEDAPIDYSSLTALKPLTDENFFNSVAMENSSLAIQYG